MALEPDELYGTSDSILPNLRAFPYEDGIRPGKLATLAGVASLPHLTPMSFDTGAQEWNVMDPAVAAIAEINGLLWAPAAPFVPSATGEKIIQVFRRGLVDGRDVPLPTTAAQTQPQLNTALQVASVTSGLEVQGIEGVH